MANNAFANAIGFSAYAAGTASTAIGFDAQATADNSTAIGSEAKATGTNSIAIGKGATATGSIAVGTNANAANGGSALGDNTIATGTTSVAVGKNATSTGSNSVAIGSNSTDNGEGNVVSVGSSGNERRIINVANGTKDTDAVNVSQLNARAASTLASANIYTDQKIDTLSKDTQRGIAGAIAMSRALMPLNAGESGFAAGFGESGGESAVAISFQHCTKNNIFLNIGASFNTYDVQVGGGIGIKF